MKQLNFLTFAPDNVSGMHRDWTGNGSAIPRRLFAFLFCLILGVGQMWADSSYDTTFGYSGKGTTWSLTNCSDGSNYWLCPTGSDPSIALIEGIFAGKTITSAVTITINNATYGSGTNPSANTFKIYNSSACTSQVTASNNSTFASSNSYVNTVYTVTQANAANFSNDLAIKITKPGRQIRLKSIRVQFSYTTAVATPYSVRFYKTDGTYEDITEESAGAGVTPPVMSTPCDGWAFQGWSKSQSTSTTSKTVLTTETLTNGKYYPSANTTLYPAYTKSGGTEFSQYQQVALGGTITAGKYLISTGSYTMAGSARSGASFSPGNTENTNYEYTVAISGSALTIKGPDNKYISGSNSNTGLSFSTTAPSSNEGKWKYTSNGIQNQQYTSRYIRAYGTTDFRHYATNNGTAAYFYKRIDADVTYYYSYPTCTPACDEPAAPEKGSVSWTTPF